ncbi:MAG: LapA family protein [Gammaproteobacteria bacterium]|nr:LapA family protein [Gammaproteobacteria bacterium]
MRIRNLILLVVLALVALFLAINWSAITANATFTLVLTSFEAPIGLVMLGLIVLLVATFGVYLIVTQGAILLETRRQAKELQNQRSLAERAEGSRVAEVKDLLRTEIARLDARLTEHEETLRTELRDGVNSLAATIGELDDRLRARGEPR